MPKDGELLTLMAFRFFCCLIMVLALLGLTTKTYTADRDSYIISLSSRYSTAKRGKIKFCIQEIVRDGFISSLEVKLQRKISDNWVDIKIWKDYDEHYINMYESRTVGNGTFRLQITYAVLDEELMELESKVCNTHSITY